MWTKTRWNVTQDYKNTGVAQQFCALEETMAFKEGKRITVDSESEVRKVIVSGTGFYLKRYFCTRGLRSWLGFSRVRGEWKNLLLFQQLTIPTASIVAYGEEFFLGRTLRGALITEELVNTCDLDDLFYGNSPLLYNKVWVDKVLKQVAYSTRTMHEHRFAHNDLKWRNILVTRIEDNPQIYFIDCPSGSRFFWPFLASRKIKDLACLDKVANKCLSNTVRLRFYKRYRGISRLTPKDKQVIRKIVHYFRGRD